MPIAYTIQDPFHWESFSGGTMNEPSRRNSLLTGRRNSLFSGVSLLDYSQYPPMPFRADIEEIDPFAPLSFDDVAHHLTKPPTTREVPRSFHLSPMVERVLSDRSESSGESSPSLASSSSSSSQATLHQAYSTPHQGHANHFEGHVLPSQQERFDDTPLDIFAPTAIPSMSQPFSANLGDSAPEEEGPDADSQRFKRFHEEKWSHRYKELLAFHREFGHSAVPHTYPRNPQLARWVKRQRRQYKLRQDGRASTMTTDRLQLLESLGFVWDSHDVNWREKLIALDAFRKLHGHCNVPSNHSDKKLATWVKCQRRQYKLHADGKPSAMTEQRIAELAQRGFEWEIRSTSSKLKM